MLRFGELKVQTDSIQHLFYVQVYFCELQPDDLRTELYANAVNGNCLVRQPMKVMRPLVGILGGYVFTARVTADRPACDYTPRLIPHQIGVTTSLENDLILWQR